MSESAVLYPIRRYCTPVCTYVKIHYVHMWSLWLIYWSRQLILYTRYEQKKSCQMSSRIYLAWYIWDKRTLSLPFCSPSVAHTKSWFFYRKWEVQWIKIIARVVVLGKNQDKNTKQNDTTQFFFLASVVNECDVLCFFVIVHKFPFPVRLGQ